ncbi:MAG: NADH dehydrogenase [Elusimicrobia bacterium GWA2_61_42]|nr:MAG: NADH dehydrogenase [Elusimicrobia bacterium GWA2_61_42]OGR74199.1 MAG: NADH dehydrogenase [Elusimicrobia bacterium GWC2_61_25]
MEFITNPLSLLIILPAAAGLALLLVPAERTGALKGLALAAALAAFLVSLKLYAGFDPAGTAMQFQLNRAWLPSFGINYFLGIDGISLLLIMLTALLMPISVLASFGYIKESPRAYYATLLFLESAMIGVFAALDLFVFYLFWEAMLIPMYFLIGVWGGPRRIYAALKFFIYTMAGSVLMLAAILWVVSAQHDATGSWTFAIPALYGGALTAQAQFWLFAAFALAFAVKVPLFPFHTWLPDAHVEAPTAGSVLLAGVLLKMGVYGYLRLAVPLFPQAAAVFAPWLAGLGVIGVIYGSLVAWSQRDMKKMVAYSSVAHLGLVMLGVMAFEPSAVAGAVLQMVNHGLSTGALFLLVGVLYERRHTRLIEDYGGLAKVMPGFAAVFMLVTLSSIGLPGLNGFVGEVLVLFGSFKVYPWLAGAAVAGVVLSAVYMLGMYQQVVFGPLRHTENRILPDLNAREWLYLLPLVILIALIGVWPNPLLRRAMPAVVDYIALSRQQAAPALPEVKIVLGGKEQE